ncbi:ribosome biogenesis protein tsr1 [Roridomyces roridus]|uniref:Ribosome biogenesis protein tsr1 n=1 Tax=Roridomyces roridus TaxID=1738132 RepID=A0AAD7FWB6_9AGAR|nr:ribosome biogenesis protein tsr1 [Roridomyces roridus]
MSGTAHHHRPTLKQQNKPFKSKHATKSSLKEAAKGRVPRESPKAGSGTKAAAQTRLNRRNNAKQAQALKRNALVSATRLFSGVDGTPRIVAVIPLTEDVSARNAVSSLAESLDIALDDCPEHGLWKMKADRFKTSLQFVNIPYKRMYAALDACKAADYVVFVLSSTVEASPKSSPSSPPTPIWTPKSRPGVLKSLLSFIQYFDPSQTRVFDLHAAADRLNALRALAEGKPADVRWREGRAWLLGEQAEWEEEAEGLGTLKVTGVARGAPLSANRLVHIPNFGDFQISKISSAPLTKPGKMEVEPALLCEAGDDADSLVSSNDPDDMANEQTWPTEEEMQGAEAAAAAEAAIPDAKQGTTPKVVRRIPKGMSEYQASWIIDESEDDADDDRRSDNEMMDAVEEEEEEMQDMPVEEDHEMETDSRRSVAFQDLDNEEEAKQLETWRNRQREEEDDLTFPDEIDTPKDVPARTRFQRFRGMRSFRTSPWDPYENLPRDYARIFQFEDFKRTERGVRRRADEELGVVEPGTRVTVYLRGVPREASDLAPVVLFALLQHEHKISVLNFTVQRNTEYDGSVRSKDPLILCVGPRRMRVNPIYSQHTRGGGKGANNVHKFERFLRHGVTSVATTYGPVAFGKQPCVWLRETEDVQAPQLVATGTFMNPDTTRVIAKRVILTGHPFKVHKKTATVRYMFFNADDVMYFKPIQLHTKYGRTGHIRESLGTHGYLKAHFDGPVNQMDTVCMSLYKRVFPKWAQMWVEPRTAEADMAMEE